MSSVTRVPAVSCLDYDVTRLNIESNASQRGVCFGRAPQNPERLLISQIRSFREINSLLNLPGKLLSLDIQKLVKKHKNDQRIPRAQNV